MEDKNLVFVEWKKYCELDIYRKPLMAALQVIRKNKCNYVADTRNGFEDNPEAERPLGYLTENFSENILKQYEEKYMVLKTDRLLIRSLKEDDGRNE